MAVSKNIDRYRNDEAYDIDPARLISVFNSANSGVVRKQSRIANEITERDPAISQAWNVRVAAIAACPWEIVGRDREQADFIERTLRNIQPAYDTKMVSFSQLLQYLQSAVMHGFAMSTTDWANGMSNINGFKIYSQSLFSFQDSDLPYFVGSNNINGIFTQSTTVGPSVNQPTTRKVFPKFPRWIYHTATNSRVAEPLRSGMVRPLAYLYTFRRHVQNEYLRGIEKYGLPMPFVGLGGALYDDNNEDKQKVNQMMASWTYDGYSLFDKDMMDIQFPTANNGFDVNDFLSYLEWSEKQIFRLILGQDSTSSSDNSNRSTAQVHNLVRQDMLASDARAVEETVNNQIIKPLFEGTFGQSNTMPVFKFRLKGVSELQEMANVVKTLDEAGYQINTDVLGERLGLDVIKKKEVVTDGDN